MAKAFKDMNQPMENSVVVFDAMNLAFRWKHSGHAKFVDSYVATVRSMLNSYGNNRAIIAADWGSSSYRKTLFPGYKGGRAAVYESQTEEEAKKFQEFIDEYERSLVELSKYFTVLRFHKVEADDIAAHIVVHKKYYGFNQIWLISTDQDWDLLIEPGVNRFAYTTRKEVTLDNWSSHHPVPPEMYLSFKCLIGDSGDSIPGVKGIGPKRAAELIAKEGDIFDIINNMPLQGKYAYIKNLNTYGAEALLLNVNLMDLRSYCDEAIGQANLVKLQEDIINGN